MCGPAVAKSFPSGWHLHQSLVDARSGENAFVSVGDDVLSPIGNAYVAGLLAHAASSCLLTTPTVNGYKRYRPNSVAPDRITWSLQHRGAMLRIAGRHDDRSTRVENRAGDPAANPYLYMASQVWSGLDGITSNATPPPITDAPYDAETGELLPHSLGEAIDLFEKSTFQRKVLGDEVVDYLATMKRSDWQRFLSHVTDWEQREYFDRF